MSSSNQPPPSFAIAALKELGAEADFSSRLFVWTPPAYGLFRLVEVDLKRIPVRPHADSAALANRRAISTRIRRSASAAAVEKWPLESHC